jgi:hypothetical protein
LKPPAKVVFCLQDLFPISEVWPPTDRKIAASLPDKGSSCRALPKQVTLRRLKGPGRVTYQIKTTCERGFLFAEFIAQWSAGTPTDRK